MIINQMVVGSLGYDRQTILRKGWLSSDLQTIVKRDPCADSFIFVKDRQKGS